MCVCVCVGGGGGGGGGVKKKGKLILQFQSRNYDVTRQWFSKQTPT